MRVSSFIGLYPRLTLDILFCLASAVLRLSASATTRRKLARLPKRQIAVHCADPGASSAVDCEIAKVEPFDGVNLRWRQRFVREKCRQAGVSKHAGHVRHILRGSDCRLPP